MACPRWQLLGGHKEGRPCWRAGSPEVGEGRGQGPVGEEGGWGGGLGCSGWSEGQPSLGPIPELGTPGRTVPADTGRPSYGWWVTRHLQIRTKKGQKGGGGHGRNTKTPRSCLQHRPRGEARTASAPARAFLTPPHLGEQKWILHLWWVFFFIILYKNKWTFRNFLFALSLSLARSLSLCFLFIYFFLSFRLFIEVGCDL